MGEASMVTWAATVLGCLCKKTQDSSVLTKKLKGSDQSLWETQGKSTAMWVIYLCSKLMNF